MRYVGWVILAAILLSMAMGSFPTPASAADEKMEKDQLVGRRRWPSIAWLIDVNAKENLASLFWVALGERRNDMEKLMRCSDLGTDCGFEACADTAEEALKILLDHARAIHGLKDIPEKDVVRLRETAQQAFCVPKGGYNPGRG